MPRQQIAMTRDVLVERIASDTNLSSLKHRVPVERKDPSLPKELRCGRPDARSCIPFINTDYYFGQNVRRHWRESISSGKSLS